MHLADFPTETFDRALARRGLTTRELCRAAGVHEQMVSDARHGRRRLAMKTWTRLTRTLTSFPLLPLADELMPEGKYSPMSEWPDRLEEAAKSVVRRYYVSEDEQPELASLAAILEAKP